MNILKKPLLLLITCCCMMLLTSCWDQRLLKDVKLVMATGFDTTEDGKVLGTIVIPVFTSNAGQAKVAESQVISGEGDTTKDIEKHINLKMSGQFNTSKMIALLFGEDYAKQGLQPGLDMFYRDPRGSLVDNAAVVKGRAIDLLNIKLNESGSMGTYLDALFENAQTNSVIPQLTKPMYSDFFDPATDIILPYIEALEHEAKFIGLALFNDTKYTGKHLNIDEAVLFMLLDNELSDKMEIKLKLYEDKFPESENYAFINVINMERKLKVLGEDVDHISAHIQLNLKVEIKEYPKNSLDSPQKLEELEKEIAEKLTEETNKVIKKLQEAKSDSLSIGRRLIAFYPATWKKIDWRETYPDIEFDAKVNAKIIKHGIFN